MTVDEMMQQAVSHHQARRLSEAETLYRGILQEHPDHPGALHMLGILAMELGQPALAVQLLRKVVSLVPRRAEAHNDLGSALGSTGQLDQAIEVCREALRLNPALAEAHNNLGVFLREAGELEGALSACSKAVRLSPAYADAHDNLGNVLVDLGRYQEAADAYRQAIRLSPSKAEAHVHLGFALVGMKQYEQAITACRQAIALDPANASAYLCLGNIFQAQSRFADAIAAYRQSLDRDPEDSTTHNNLGVSLLASGEAEESLAAHRRALQLAPRSAEAHCNIGVALQALHRHSDAIEHYREALRANPSFASAQNNLGNTLLELGRIEEALSALRRAIELEADAPAPHYNLSRALKVSGSWDEAMAECDEAIRLEPGYAKAYNHLGNCYKDQGRLDQAIQCYQKAVEFDPDAPWFHSNLLYALCFHPDYDAERLRIEHAAWDRLYAQPLKNGNSEFRNERSPSRRIRIGYVSPDFCAHVVGLNILPLLREHSAAEVETYCYANVQHPDEVTGVLQGLCNHWRDIFGVRDEKVAEMIRADEIDILVDLSLHMGGGRLLVFARKPAPVQVTFAGYPGSTGLEAMDYRLTDPYLDPPGLHDAHYQEKSLRLGHSFWCYDSEAMSLGMETPPPVAPLPAMETGILTFGSLNNFCKTNSRVFQLWAQVLRSVEKSRLILRCGEGSHRKEVLAQFDAAGVAPDRIEFVPRCSREEYLHYFDLIDIGLDTFPYNGHTTSLDSLWMGVPVVTLVGETVVGRAGLSQSSNLGLTQLIARTPEQFVQIAVGLSLDLEGLAALRRDLRTLMQNSPLTDAVPFAREVEAAYRQMWRDFCRRPSP